MGKITRSGVITSCASWLPVIAVNLAEAPTTFMGYYAVGLTTSKLPKSSVMLTSPELL